MLAIGVSGWVELAFIMILAGAFDATSNPRQLAAIGDLALPCFGRALLWTLVGVALVQTSR